MSADVGNVNRPNCPVCSTAIDDSPRVCERCSTPHHEDCWEYVGDCAIFGCAAVPAGKSDVMSANARQELEGQLRAWMSWYKVYTYSLLGISGSTFYVMIMSGISIPVMMHAASTGNVHLEYLFNLVFIAPLALSSLVFVLSFFPSQYYRFRVSRMLGRSGQPTGKASVRLVENLTMSPFLQFLQPKLEFAYRWLNRCAVFFVLWMISFAVMVNRLSRYSAFRANLPILGFFLIYIFIAAPIIASRNNLLYYSCLKNRMMISFKEKGEG